MNPLIARYEAMLVQRPDNELARFSLGKACYDAGDFARATTELEKALAGKPDWMVVQILLGKCALALGQRDRARDAFERARQLAVEQDHDGPREEMERCLAELSD